PCWCALPNEDIPWAPPPPEAGFHVHLDTLFQCACGTWIQMEGQPDPPPFSIQPATIFRLITATPITIEVLPYAVCHHHHWFFGSELGALAVLNWNNTFLFTHELLNGYTNAFMVSETPFAAFCLTICYQYE
ncbi:hypothetical protein BD413DRAFT_451762, partial [Trametes elegans]